VQIGAASESMPLEIVPAELDKMPIVQEFKN
jgi:hypothetical protein